MEKKAELVSLVVESVWRRERENNRGERVKGKWWGMVSASRLNRRDRPIYRYVSHKKVEKFE